MHKRNGLETRGAGLGVKFVTLLIILLLVFACTPSTKIDEEWRGEIKDLRKEVKALGEKLDKLEAGQQALLMVLKQAAPPPQMSVLPAQPMLPPQVQPPAMPSPMTVAQLLAGKDQYLGARVTVQGEAGPVLVHHKSVLLKSPQGMVEVLFGKLPDQKQVVRLTSTPINQPLTVTGVVSLPPGPAGAAKLQITAESVDF